MAAMASAGPPENPRRPREAVRQTARQRSRLIMPKEGEIYLTFYWQSQDAERAASRNILIECTV